MKYTALELPGVWLIEPVRHRDARGYFSETFRADSFAEATGLDVDFVQENESESVRGTVRGLHFQAGSSAQAKLVRVCRGAIVDVVVDLRKTSPTFGRHLAVELSDENGRQLFVPRGFAHGFAVVSDTAPFSIRWIITTIRRANARCCCQTRLLVSFGRSQMRRWFCQKKTNEE